MSLKSYSSNDRVHRRDTLEYRISRRDGSEPILGLQRVFVHQADGCPDYYKCILCGAHGELDAMYFHLIGNKHNDKYIRLRTFSKYGLMSSQERFLTRNKIASEENYSVRSISVISGIEYYPFPWANEGKHRNMKVDVDGSPFRYSYNYEPKGFEVSRYRIGPKYRKVEGGNEMVVSSKRDKNIQSYSPGFMRIALCNLNAISEALRTGETDVSSPEDMEADLQIIKQCLGLLAILYRNKSGESEKEEKIKVALDFLNEELFPSFKKALKSK